METNEQRDLQRKGQEANVLSIDGLINRETWNENYKQTNRKVDYITIQDRTQRKEMTRKKSAMKRNEHTGLQGKGQ